MRRKALNFTGVALGVVFVLGIARLFTLRFEAGDVYPPYSSLRADPLGVKAYHDSLAGLPDITVRRNYASNTRLLQQPKQVLLVFGLPREAVEVLPEFEVKEIEQLAAKGDRLVLTLLPVVEVPKERPKSSRDSLKSDSKKEKAKARDQKEKEEKKPWRDVALTNRWGFSLAYTNLVLESETVTDSPAAVWHTTLYFDQLAKPWRTIETREKYPVVIERDWGDGTIVLCADSYFISNEALRRDRRADLLAWLIGPHRVVTFDETHLGVVENPGVMTLARKYRLHGLIAALALLAALFIWKSATAFVPPVADTADTSPAPAVGRDSAAGFVNLLRRSIPPSALLEICLAEWKKSFGHTPRTAPKLEQIEAVLTSHKELPAHKRDPVAGYATIATILTERKTP